MQELEKRITGDWFIINEASHDYLTLTDFFKVQEDNLTAQIDSLRSSVEKGIIEYKTSCISPLFRLLESLKYESPAFNEFEEQIKNIEAFLFIILIQRLFSSRTLKFSHEKIIEEDDISKNELDLKDILSDINLKINENPELKKTQTIKNILLQVTVIKNEKETMKKLLPTIKPENRDSFINNFQNIFTSRENKIRNNYLEMLKEEKPVLPTHINILDKVPLKNLTPTLTSQSKSISKLRSTLIFAKEEKYKIRELLLNLLASEKAIIDDLFNKEDQIYHDFARELNNGDQYKKDRAFHISRAFCNEISTFLS